MTSRTNDIWVEIAITPSSGLPAYTLSSRGLPAGDDAPQGLSFESEGSTVDFPSASVAMSLRGDQVEPWTRCSKIERGDLISLCACRPGQAPRLFFSGYVAGVRFQVRKRDNEMDLTISCASPFRRLLEAEANSSAVSLAELAKRCEEVVADAGCEVELGPTLDQTLQVQAFGNASYGFALRHVSALQGLSLDLSKPGVLAIQTIGSAKEEFFSSTPVHLGDDEILSMEYER